MTNSACCSPPTLFRGQWPARFIDDTGIGLAGVVVEFVSPIAAALTVFGVWLAVADAVVLSWALTDLEPMRNPGSGRVAETSLQP